MPGIGTIYGFLQSIHAREICVGEAPFSIAMFSIMDSSSRLFSISSL